MSREVPDPVRVTLQALTDGLFAILGDRLVAVYVGGSLAMGDFCLASSDIDFLVVTRGHLNLEESLAVELLHKDLLKRYPDAARLEGDYAPLAVIVPEGTTEPVPGFERGKFLPRVGEIMLSADNIANMRDSGIAFFGRPPAEVLPPVSSAQVRTAVRAMLKEGLAPCESPKEVASALLSLVRSGCALEKGVPVTKSEGAHWGLTHLPARWHMAIRAALAVRCAGATAADEACLLEIEPQLAALSDSFVAL